MIGAEYFRDCPSLDALVFPEGFPRSMKMRNERLNGSFGITLARARIPVGCSGSFILLAAVPQERRANALKVLTGCVSRFDVVEERFVRDGNVWSAVECLPEGSDAAFHAATAGAELPAKSSITQNIPHASLYGPAHFSSGKPAYMKTLWRSS